METYATTEKSKSTSVDAITKIKQQSFFAPVKVQPKLTIGAVDDPYEREADAMAEQVMRMPDTKINPTFFQPTPLKVTPVQRKCASCEEEEKLRRKENSTQPVEASSETRSYINSLSSKGSSLPKEAKSFFEPRFGRDFSDVKIHDDSVAAKSVQTINALAYTSDNNIVFNQNQFAPNSDSGKKLLAHELTHVIQQSKSANSETKVQCAGGWKDAQGLNNKQDQKIGKIIRLPIEDLLIGNQDKSMSFTKTNVKTGTAKTIAANTKEKANGKAIILFYENFDPIQPAEILLFLHGHNEGFREVTNKTVMDISSNQLEKQLEASGRLQMIGFLPQGTLNSGFGNLASHYDAAIGEALKKTASIMGWTQPPAVADIVLSAHSGGGDPISNNLSNMPSNTRVLAMYESIHNDYFKDWVAGKISEDVKQLANKNLAAQASYLSTSFQFRGYYTEYNPKIPNSGLYVPRYTDLEKTILKRLLQPDIQKLPPSIISTLADHYKVIKLTGVSHNDFIGKSNTIEDTLSVLPTIKGTSAPVVPSGSGTPIPAGTTHIPGSQSTSGDTIQRAPLTPTPSTDHPTSAGSQVVTPTSAGSGAVAASSGSTLDISNAKLFTPRSGQFYRFPAPTTHTNDINRPQFIHPKSVMQIYGGAGSNNSVKIHPALDAPLNTMMVALLAEGSRLNDESLKQSVVASGFRAPEITEGKHYLSALKKTIAENPAIFGQLALTSNIEALAVTELGFQSSAPFQSFRSKLAAQSGWSSDLANQLIKITSGFKAPRGASTHHSGLVVDINFPFAKDNKRSQFHGIAREQNANALRSTAGMWLNKFAINFGFDSYNTSKEIWHMEWRNWQGSSADPNIPPTP